MKKALALPLTFVSLFVNGSRILVRSIALLLYTIKPPSVFRYKGSLKKKENCLNNILKLKSVVRYNERIHI